MGQISLEQAVRNAIEVERAAERFYGMLAESTDDAEARRFLFKMRTQESEHAKQIQQMGQKIVAGELPFRADDNMELVETAPEWAFTDDLSFDDAITLAIELEDHAAMFYDALASSTKGAIAEFFGELVKQEEMHASVLRERYRKVEP